MLLDPLLRDMVDPTQHAMFDWMHCWFVGGIFNVHMGRFMHTMTKKGVLTYAKLDAYIKLWHWLGHVGTMTGKDACGTRRAKSSWDAGIFKCTVSEGRSLLPIIANYVQQVLMKSPDQDVRKHAECFLKLAHVVELLEIRGPSWST